jgi:hypothetical protein
VVIIPESRRLTEPPSVFRLIKELELDDEVRKCRWIKNYRVLTGDENKPDEQVLQIDKFSNPEGTIGWTRKDLHGEKELEEAIERTKLFKVDEISGFPILPDSVCYTSRNLLISEYLDIVFPLGEAPEVFHLAALLSAVSTATARQTFYEYGSSRVYLNTWNLLVGSTACGKTEAARRGLELLTGMNKWLSSREIKVNRNFRSAQALLLEMQRKRDRGTHPLLHYTDEFPMFIETIQSSRGGNCIGLLNDAYGCGRLENRTKNDSITVEDSFLSMLACGAPEDVAKLRRVSSTLRHPAWEFTDFLSLSFGRVALAC